MKGKLEVHVKKTRACSAAWDNSSARLAGKVLSHVSRARLIWMYKIYKICLVVSCELKGVLGINTFSLTLCQTHVATNKGPTSLLDIKSVQREQTSCNPQAWHSVPLWGMTLLPPTQLNYKAPKGHTTYYTRGQLPESGA